MTILTPETNITENDHAYELLEYYSTVVVLSDVTLMASGSGYSAIYINSLHADLLLDGLAVSEDGAAITWASGLGTYTHQDISIGASGQIYSGGHGVYGVGGDNVVSNSGTIRASGDGIRVEGDRSQIANHGVIEGETGIYLISGEVLNTGTIMARTGISAQNDIYEDVDIVNHGDIFGSISGIALTGDHLNVVNTGTVVGENYAIDGVGGYVRWDVSIFNSGLLLCDSSSHGAVYLMADNVNIVNEGEIVNNNSTGNAIYVSGDDVFIENSGELVGGDFAIKTIGYDAVVRNSGDLAGGIWVTGHEFDITNSGHVEGAIFIHPEHANAEKPVIDLINDGSIDATSFDDNFHGIEVYCQSSLITNNGTIAGQIGIYLAEGNNNTIVNHGEISATGYGIAVYESGNTIHNTGNIQSARSDGVLLADQGVLLNSGVISGDEAAIESTGEDVRVVNSGVLIGDVFLGEGASVYIGRAQGRVEGAVYGEDGDDRLFGARQSDQLDGGAGDDRLAGRYGADDLTGGDGADRLIGGQGDDTLTGGADADVFVFGKSSGTDSIADFEQGVDMIQLSAQPGGFDGLAIVDDGIDLIIQHASGTIVLNGLAGLDLSQADFDFV